MTEAKPALPPGPTFVSEWKRPWKEVAEEVSYGVLHNVRCRFERFGDMYVIDGWPKTVYVTRHPEHMHEVLVTRASSFGKRLNDLDSFLGQGLLSSEGALWRKQRRAIQPAFSHANIQRYAEVMVELTQRRLATWSSGQTHDLNREMMELTLAVVCKAVLDYESAEALDVVAFAMHVLQSTAGFDVLPRWLPNPIAAKKKKAAKALDALIYSIIDERAANPGKDLISQLLVGTDGEGMDRRQLRDELVTLFLAGHETTALSMTWSFFLLAKYPHQEAKLHEELDRVLGGRVPTFADLDALVHTRLVIQEAMRMFPPLYMLPRAAREDTEVGGYKLAKGSEILLWVYFMHHDPRWFPRPAEFRPERFLPDSGEVLHSHAYAPFGAGPRACIGSRFAMVEAQLLLAAIAQRFRVKLAPGQDVHLNPRITMGPQKPIMVELEARGS